MVALTNFPIVDDKPSQRFIRTLVIVAELVSHVAPLSPAELGSAAESPLRRCDCRTAHATGDGYGRE